MEGEKKYLHTLILPLLTRYAVTGITRACVKVGRVSIHRSPRNNLCIGADPVNLSGADSA